MFPKWLIPVFAVVAGLAVMVWNSGLHLGDDSSSDHDISALRTSNVMAVGSRAVAATGRVQQVIGDRALFLVVQDPTPPSVGEYTGIDIAKQVVREYPRSVAFVLQDGRVHGSEIGTDARVGDYSSYSLIDDYYDVQLVAGGDPVALSRQLSLLYDRLAAEGSIHGATRATYDPPSPPWVIIAIGLVLALLAAALLIRLAARRVAAAEQVSAEQQARRAALGVRLSEPAELLVNAPAQAGSHTLASLGRRRAELLHQISTAPPEELDSLERRLDEFIAQVRRAVAAT